MSDVESPPLSRKLHDLSGQVALITGIGCTGEGWGNGMAIATLFARQGAAIVGCDIILEAGERTRARILSENADADVTVVQADVASSKSMEAFVETCMRIHGRVDILVNNVGVGSGGDAAATEESAWDRLMDINLKGVYLTSHFVLPIMEKSGRGGVIVNISSLAALRHLSDGIGYATSKGAILSFSRSTALTYARRGIRVNTVIPGMMNTPLLRMVGPDYEGFCRRRDAQCPMGKMGTAWDVANAALFLASKEASYITGTEIVVDGGFLHGGPVL